MALQPAAGARDLNPRQVEGNRRIREQLAATYRLWGYQEVDPPSVERLDTLAAGGGIAAQELVRLASDEPLGLRPELTASIARAACTRMADRPMPLRLWADGNTFRTTVGDGGSQRINQEIHSGVELLGEPSLAADVELMRLLLAAAGAVGLGPQHRPTLLIGHHGVLQELLGLLPDHQREPARSALTSYDLLGLEALELDHQQRLLVRELLCLRGEPVAVLAALQRWLGPLAQLQELQQILDLVTPAATASGVTLQLDPTFQPHFNLYDGLVLKLVCQGDAVPVAIASGGRYDSLVGRFSTPASLRNLPAAGVGFGLDVEAVRDLVQPETAMAAGPLVAFSQADQLQVALDALEALHRNGTAAELHSHPVASLAAAEAIAAARGCLGVHWLGG
ncbi:MAG: ATP phosphoribosyltransferase regulatory subunit [Cyanobacteria bacterium M_surface_9_m1_291]|nr:ATP phosphoribosyltransferase regulatory subunit [Cyanobacteria bacterium M_surface_9_m1_291]